MKIKLYSTYKLIYIHSYIFIAKEALNALKLNGKICNGAWHLDIPTSNVAGNFQNVSRQGMLKDTFYFVSRTNLLVFSKIQIQ